MTNKEMIKILRERTASAIVNYGVNKFGESAYYHRGRKLILSMDDLPEFLIGDIENEARKEVSGEQADLFIIDIYTSLLNKNSTGKDIDINVVQLSPNGIELIEVAFNEIINRLIAEGIYQ